MSRLNIFAAIQGKIDYYKSLDAKDKTTYWKETLINKMCIRDRTGSGDFADPSELYRT